MAKFLVLWHYNSNAPWPTDPVEGAKMTEMMFATIDKNLKDPRTGTLEFGWFPNGTSGYAIGTGEAKDAIMRVYPFYPFIEADVHEMIPYETGKEIIRGILKAQL